MKFNSNLPIYIQISNYLKKEIASGNLKEGNKLQSVRELSTEVKANPNTIMRAYSELEREDLVFTQRGMGTFVTKDKNVIRKLKEDMAANIIKVYISDMQSIGFSNDEILNKIEKQIREEIE